MKLTSVLARLDAQGPDTFAPHVVSSVLILTGISDDLRPAVEELIFERADMIEALREARVLLHRAAFMHGCVCHVLEPGPEIEGKCLPCAAREAVGAWQPEPRP